MGKFIDTRYDNFHESIVKIGEDLVKNPLYPFNDKKGVRVIFYNPNTEKSTLDPGSLLAYSQTGNNSPIRFDKINGLYLYQFPRIEFNFEDDEFGLHSGPIEGESYILPNIFDPIEGAFFTVDHIKDSTWLFKVNNVQKDTFDNGGNGYKINWILDQTTNKEILNNVVGEYDYIDVESGTNLKAVVRHDKFKKAKILDDLSVTLCNYFYELFYNPNVQTFIWQWLNCSRMYDPFAIEFMKRNKLMDPIQSKVFVTHMTELTQTFSIDYNRSIYRAFELKEKTALKSSAMQSQADFISDMGTIFYSMFDDYYMMTYHVIVSDDVDDMFIAHKDVIEIMGDDLYNHIISGKKYSDTYLRFLNIIVAHFNEDTIWYPDLQRDIEFLPAATNHALTIEQTFYYLLFTIYCIDCEIRKLLS